MRIVLRLSAAMMIASLDRYTKISVASASAVQPMSATNTIATKRMGIYILSILKVITRRAWESSSYYYRDREDRRRWLVK